METSNMEVNSLQIIKWDPKTKTFYFKKNDQIYKARIIDHNRETDILTLYIFNTNQTIFIPFKISSLLKSKNFTNQFQNNMQEKNIIVSPLCGKIIKIEVKQDQFIKKDLPLVTIESMKMENEVRAPFDLFVKSVSIFEGDLVKQDQELIKIETNHKPIKFPT